MCRSSGRRRCLSYDRVMGRDGAGVPVVGRELEFEQLRRLARSRTVPVVVVTGPAGVGKTLMMNTLAAEAAEAGVGVIRGRCLPGVTSQFGAWRRPARTLGVELPDHDETIPPSEQVWELVDLLRDALVAAAPVCLAIDDLHWADEASLATLRELVHDLVGRAVSVVATSREFPRSDGLEELLAGCNEIRLGPLDDAGIAALLGSLTGAPLGRGDVDRVRAVTGGNPLLVREMALGGLETSSAAARVLDATLARAGGDALDLLSVLAIAGPTAGPDLLAEVAGTSRSSMLEVLASAAQVGVLTADDAGWWFAHDLLADAARDRVDGSQLRALHASIAAIHRRDGRPGEASRHLASALPSHATPEDLLAVAREAVARTRGARRPMEAASIAEQALEACRRAGAGPSIVQPLLVDLADSLWDAGELARAIEVFESAAATEVDDLELVAAAEAGRHRLHSWFQPDPDGRARLQHLDAEFGDRDTAVRVELLGRLGALAIQPPADVELAADSTRRAVAMAERLGDPRVMLQALHDRFLRLATPAQVRERDERADELVALARRSGRPDLSLFGLEARCHAELQRGDASAARRTVDEMDALGTVNRLVNWRLSAVGRRSALDAAGGHLERALEALDVIDELTANLPPAEAHGWRMGTLASTLHLYQVTDDRLAHLVDIGNAVIGDVPACFIQVATALGELAIGRHDRARARAGPWLASPHRAVESPSPRVTMHIMASLMVEFDDRRNAPALRSMLLPFAGDICFDSGIVQVDSDLAELHRLCGDTEAAVEAATRAVDAARRLDFPALEARALAALAAAEREAGNESAAISAYEAAEHLAGGIGLALVPEWRLAPPASVETSARVVRFVPAADGWTLTVGSDRTTLPSTIGMHQLIRLLADAGREIDATTLAGANDADAAPVQADLGPALDARAKREYRQRISELQSEIDEAESNADIERVARLRVEYDLLLDELRRATGLGGRDRPQGSGSERARVNVTRSLRRAIAVIAEIDADLGAHLSMSVRTGRSCAYEPDPTAALHLVVES
jgi:tetratricopeptide (TPR) repeat protein